jgi:hypothetical protein
MNEFAQIGRLVLLLAVCSSAVAETQWSQVELIVFAQKASSSELFEQTESRIEWPGDLVELSEPPMALADLTQMPLPYVPLQKGDFVMTPAYQTLQLQGGYRPLLHIAWVQPVETAMMGLPVHVHGGGKSGESELLNGFVQIGSGDRLFLSVDLEYTPPAQNSEAIVYRIHEQRPIQLDEVHYLDHPKFGILGSVSLLR